MNLYTSDDIHKFPSALYQPHLTQAQVRVLDKPTALIILHSQ